MTDPTFESRLGAELRRHTDQALRPVDPYTVAQMTIAAGRPRWGIDQPALRALGLVAMTALLVLALVVAGMVAGGPRPAPSLPTDRGLGIVASPSDSTFATPTYDPCPTRTTRILTGAAMPPAAAQPLTLRSGGVDFGAYLTQSQETPVHADLWSVTAGVAQRIAAIENPDSPTGTLITVDAVSSDGRFILVSLGTIHGGLPGPDCVDRYLVGADGSTVQRITDNHLNGGVAGWPVLLSVDQRYIAFPEFSLTSSGTPDHSGLAVSDRNAPTLDPQVFACGLSSGASLPFAWAPTDDQRVEICDGQLVYQGYGIGTGLPEPVPAQDVVAFGWPTPDRLVIVSVDPASPAKAIDVRTVGVRGRGVSFAATFSSPRRLVLALEPELGPSWDSVGPALSADGSSLFVAGVPAADASASPALELVQLDTGRSTIVAPSGVLEASWSADGRAIVYVRQGAAGGAATLTVYDVAAHEIQFAQTLPDGYVRGIWVRANASPGT